MKSVQDRLHASSKPPVTSILLSKAEGLPRRSRHSNQRLLGAGYPPELSYRLESAVEKCPKFPQSLGFHLPSSEHRVRALVCLSGRNRTLQDPLPAALWD